MRRRGFPQVNGDEVASAGSTARLSGRSPTMSRHIYTVELRIVGNNIEPDSITEKLGLQPCRAVHAGSRRADGREIIASWAFSGGGDEKSEWASLEEGLQFVLAKVWPLRHAIAAYKNGGELIWWCGHFQASFDGGPSLSSDLLKKLGEFGANIFIDNYFYESADSAVGSQRNSDQN
jgi:hypothetical protein